MRPTKWALVMKCADIILYYHEHCVCTYSARRSIVSMCSRRRRSTGCNSGPILPRKTSPRSVVAVYLITWCSYKYTSVHVHVRIHTCSTHASHMYCVYMYDVNTCTVHCMYMYIQVHVYMYVHVISTDGEAVCHSQAQCVHQCQEGE